MWYIDRKTEYNSQMERSISQNLQMARKGPSSHLERKMPHVNICFQQLFHLIAALIIFHSWHPQLDENTQSPRTNILCFYQRNWKNKAFLPGRNVTQGNNSTRSNHLSVIKPKYCQQGGGIKLLHKSLKYSTLAGIRLIKIETC